MSRSSVAKLDQSARSAYDSGHDRPDRLRLADDAAAAASAPTAPTSATSSTSCSTWAARPPRVNGFVVGGVQRRRVFVGAGRVGEIDTRGVRLRRGAINLRQFELREGERLVVGELFGRRVNGRRVVDIGLQPAPEPFAWEVATVALATPAAACPDCKRTPEVIDWSEAGELFAEQRPVDRQAATLGGLHPAEMASEIRSLPLSRRRLLAEALEDERLADLLEELPEDEQVRLIEGLDPERVGRVLDEMEADDAADLLGEMSRSRAGRAARRDGPRGGRAGAPPADLQAGHGRRPDDAGADHPRPRPRRVAEALAQRAQPRPAGAAGRAGVRLPAAARDADRAASSASSGSSACCASRRPSRSAAASTRSGSRSTPSVSDREVAGRLAAYNVVAIPVVDDAGRLVGAVTIDDVLDRVLPRGWRMTHTTRANADTRPMARKDDLSTPRAPAAARGYDADAFARWAESVARFLGTGRYLAAQTIFVDRLDRAQRRPGIIGKLGPVPVHPAEPRLLDPGRVRRAADPAGPEPPGRPRQGGGRARPRDQRALAGRDRVPRARDRGGAARCSSRRPTARIWSSRSSSSRTRSSGCTASA